MDVRTNQQNKSLHKWLDDWSHELNNSGHTIQDIVEQYNTIEIRPNKENLKQVVIHPYIKAAFGHDSTTKLTSEQLNEVIDAVTKLFGHITGSYIPFPTDEPND